jgi:hypothetical protein
MENNVCNYQENGECSPKKLYFEPFASVPQFLQFARKFGGYSLQLEDLNCVLIIAMLPTNING